MWSSILNLASGAMKLLNWLTSRIEEQQDREDGARMARVDSLEEDKANTRKANEIEAINGGTAIDVLDARDRLRQRD